VSPGCTVRTGGKVPSNIPRRTVAGDAARE
jgi:hypothetical protein